MEVLTYKQVTNCSSIKGALDEEMSEGNGTPGKENQIFVGGISWRANEASLAKFFQEKFGRVMECKIIVDKVTGSSKGYGFITFAEKEHAEKAKKEDGLHFLGKKINIGSAVRSQKRGYDRDTQRGYHGGTIGQMRGGTMFYNQPAYPSMYYPMVYYPTYPPRANQYYPPYYMHPQGYEEGGEVEPPSTNQ